MPLGYRLKAYFFFKIFAPLSTQIGGYVAAKTFRFMEDLPSEVVREWGDWCSDPAYFFSERFIGKTLPLGHFQDFAFPIAVLSASDDEISTPENLRIFWQHVHSPAGVRFKRYDAATFPDRAIGHLGYFKRNNQAIWTDILEVIQSFR